MYVYQQCKYPHRYGSHCERKHMGISYPYPVLRISEERNRHPNLDFDYMRMKSCHDTGEVCMCEAERSPYHHVYY